VRLARRRHCQQPELTVVHLTTSMLLNVRNGMVVLAAALAISASDARAQEPRVRAKEPTVVTVEGKSAEVKPEASRSKGSVPQKNVFRRTIGGVGQAFVFVGRGISSWVGGVFDGEDVVPAEAERKRSSERKQR
jgi:hypothetical protein